MVSRLARRIFFRRFIALLHIVQIYQSSSNLGILVFFVRNKISSSIHIAEVFEVAWEQYFSSAQGSLALVKISVTSRGILCLPLLVMVVSVDIFQIFFVLITCTSLSATNSRETFPTHFQILSIPGVSNPGFRRKRMGKIFIMISMMAAWLLDKPISLSFSESIWARGDLFSFSDDFPFWARRNLHADPIEIRRWGLLPLSGAQRLSFSQTLSKYARWYFF